MGQEEELLRIAKKLEKMVARKKTVRLAFGTPRPTPGGTAPRSLRVPGERAGGAPGRRARDSGPREAWQAQGSAPFWGLLGTTEGACAWLGAPGAGIAWAPKTRLVHVPMDV